MESEGLSMKENKEIQNIEEDILDPADIIVTLDLDDNVSVDCEIYTIFEVQNQDYIALVPLQENGERNEEGDVYLYRYFEDEKGTPSLDNIESDEEFEIVSDRFDELLDEEDFETL